MGQIMPWFRIPFSRRSRRIASLVLLCLLAGWTMFAIGTPGRGAGSARADQPATTQAPALHGMLAYIAAGDVWTRSDTAIARITNGGDVTAVRWSPGGGWLLVTRAGRTLAITADGSRAVQISGAWLPDDSAVASATSDGGVELVDPVGGAAQPLIAGSPDLSYLPVAWSTDGSTLALVRRPLNQKGVPTSESAWLVQRDGGRLRSLVAAGATWPRPFGWSPDGRFLEIVQGPPELCVSCRADGQQVDIVSADGNSSYAVGKMVRPDTLSWVPDSAAVVASVGGGRESYRDKSLVRLSLITGARTVIAEEAGSVEIQPAVAPDGGSYTFTRGPAVSGPSFTNLDVQHGYPAATAERRIWLGSLNGTTLMPIFHVEGQSEEAPRWAGPNSLLFVRWQPAQAGHAPVGQIWFADTVTGSQALLVDSFGTATSNVGYFGMLGWSSAYAWRP